MAQKIAGAPFHQTVFRPRVWSTRRFGSSMSKDGSGCLPRIGKRAPAFTASFIEDRHVVEGPGHVRVVRTERFFLDRQRALVQPLRLAVLPLPPIHDGQIVKSLAHLSVARAQRFFSDRQCALKSASASTYLP